MTLRREQKVFIKAFNFKKIGFHDPVLLKDKKLGFSMKIKYDKKITRKLKRQHKGSNYMALLYIYASDQDLYNKNLALKPIIARATPGFIGNNGEFRIFDNYKRSDPIELVSEGDYFYDVENNAFFKDEKKISADNIIQEIYDLHIKPTKILWGAYLRFKLLFWKTILFWLVNKFSQICILALQIISSNKHSYNVYERYFDIVNEDSVTSFEKHKEKKENIKGKKITLFGYAAISRTTISYCGFHFIAYTIFAISDFTPQYITTVFTNNFLTVIYVILTLSFWDLLLPKLLNILIESSSKLAFKLLHSKIEV